MVTGAVDEAGIREVVERSFTDIVPTPVRRQNAVMNQPAYPGSFALDGGFEDITVECAFRIPDLTLDDIAPLDMLASILAGSRNAVLRSNTSPRARFSGLVMGGFGERARRRPFCGGAGSSKRQGD